MPNNAPRFDRREAYAMIQDGQKLAVIADHFKVSHVAIIQAMKKLNWPASAKAYKAAVAAGTLPAELIAP